MSLQEQQTDLRGGFKQEMQTRHIVMLALGGVIGTGLFLTSGYTVNQAGPLGAVIAYIIGALMVYLVMMCLGELAVQMPETGSFSTYATRFLGPGTGYTVAWLYWLTWTVAIGSEFMGRSHYRIFHTTATVGTLAAAVAVGKLMEFPLGACGLPLAAALRSE